MSPTSPITPARRYRDEFSHLALAFNKMIHELERRHTILIESHKTRAIGNLVDGVAHEPNNPLNNIFLTASALEEVLRGSIRLVSDQVKMGKVALEASIPPDLPPVHGDGQMLAQVFVNLILNAVDVLPEKGRTWIEVHPNPGKESIAVDVRDDGPGIPEHVMDRIFDPFFTTKAGGTGLGLSVSMGIVKKLVGTYPGTVTDPWGPPSGSNRVVRGGSWAVTRLVRAACRYGAAALATAMSMTSGYAS